MPIKSRHDVRDAIAQRIIWCFWTGTNSMSEQRRCCFENLLQSTECDVVLVTRENLNEFISPEYPLHAGYECLSETQRSDYLRTYFMHLYGGGYSDIKTQTGSWLTSFAELAAQPEMFAIGYTELSDGVPTYLLTPSGLPLSNYWELLIGNGAFIFKSGTDLTREWFLGLHQRMDDKLTLLLRYPARFPRDRLGAVYEGTESNYPLKWAEVQAAIFHPICFKYFGKLLNTLPPPNFTDYL